MTTQAKKRKYYQGQIEFGIDGSISHGRKIDIFDNEIVSYDGANGLVVQRDGVIYDLSKYTFDKPVFHAPNSQSSYRYVNGQYKTLNVVATIYNGLKKDNFVFQDHFLYYRRDKNGHYFKSRIDGRQHYVTGSDFDKYFVPNMIKGEVKGKFTYAKHGAMYWVTLVTD